VVKWDANGDFDWMNQFQGVWGVRVVDVELAPDGNLFVLGGFVDTLDLDPGPGIQLATGPFNDKTFLVNLDGAGIFNWGWAIDPGRNNPIRPWKVAVDTDGDFAIAGEFAGSFDFDPGPASVVLNSSGGNDGFVAQWSDTSAVVGVSPAFEGIEISVSPNPNEGTFRLSSSEMLKDGRITMVNLEGRIVYEKRFAELKDAVLNLELPAGLYLVRIESQGRNTCLRVQVN
jgi:hypothetical protein